MAQATPTRVKYYRSVKTVTGWTIFLLVLLRVAVGWHFFYEGWWKLNSGGNFSSTPYLMASVGPFKDVFHWMVDDMDGTKRRLNPEKTDYFYEQLDRKCNAILRHYGIQNGQGYQDKELVQKLQKKANGDLTNMQLNRLLTKKENGTLTPEEKAILEKAQAAAAPLTPAEQAQLNAESKKLTKEQVDSLKAFVERKKHGVTDNNTVAKLFDNDQLFVKQVRYAGEYADPTAVDKTNQITVATCVAIPEKQAEIVKAVETIILDLEDTVKQGARDVTLAEDQTKTEHESQGQKVAAALPPVKVIPDGATDSSWITRSYVESLIDKRYEELKKAYELTDRQQQSKYGGRYRDQKKNGHYDRNCIDLILSDPDFRNDLANYKQLLAQIDTSEKHLDTQFDDQRQDFDTGKKRTGLRNKLLARVEAPLGEVDLQKILELGEYVGPIKDITQAQLSLGPVPVNPREFEFPGRLFKQAGLSIPNKTLTYWQDLGMMVGLTVIGLCLMLGLFTRFASLCGAIMLAMFYLCMPPFPGAKVPENAAEGHYLFVNKNLIEMIVMLVFATSGIGRWCGLDAFIHAIFGRRVKEEVEAPAPGNEVGSDKSPVFVTGQRGPAASKDWGTRA